jgi:flagellar biogenesis protein FliO
MHTALGLLGLLVYMIGIISLAAGVTWLVVKLSPSKSQKQLEARQQKTS